MYLLQRELGKTRSEFYARTLRVTGTGSLPPAYHTERPRVWFHLGYRFCQRNTFVHGSSNRAKLHAVSTRIRLFVTTLLCLLVVTGRGFAAQDSTSSSSTSSTHKKKSTASSSTHKTTASKKSTSRKPRKKVTAARAHQMKKTFVASNDLRPMARQLVEFRTPAAYAGVENYAHTHAGTEAGSLAWFAIGYAHYLDAQYPAAITALQKAEPQIGELKDYVAFFIGNSYVLSNNPEESLAYLRDFGTRFPDSLYDHDAMIADAKAMLALNQPAETIRLLEAHRMPGQRRDRILPGAKPTCRAGGRRPARKFFSTSITVSRRTTWPTSLRRSTQDSGRGAFSRRQRTADHLKRADALYKARRCPAAAEEYQYVVDLSPAGQQSAGLIQLANSYIKDGNTRESPKRRWTGSPMTAAKPARRSGINGPKLRATPKTKLGWISSCNTCAPLRQSRRGWSRHSSAPATCICY